MREEGEGLGFMIRFTASGLLNRRIRHEVETAGQSVLIAGACPSVESTGLGVFRLLGGLFLG